MTYTVYLRVRGCGRCYVGATSVGVDRRQAGHRKDELDDSIILHTIATYESEVEMYRQEQAAWDYLVAENGVKFLENPRPSGRNFTRNRPGSDVKKLISRARRDAADLRNLER